MKIVIYLDSDDVQDNILTAAVLRVRHRGNPESTHGIHVQTPDRHGRQDALLVFNADDEGRFVRGQSMTVCQFQRELDAPVEYHS